MTRKKNKVSVVIPAFNASKTIKQCLDSIVNQKVDDKYEIIVVDDGSVDDTAKIIKLFKKVTYIFQKNAGPATARNRGWKGANGEIVVFTDSDCVPEKDWLREMIRPFSKYKDLGAVGGAYGKTINKDKKLAVLIGEEIKYRYTKIGKWTDAHGSYSLAVKKEVLKKVGGFNKFYPVATAEDWDLCYKITKAGYKIYFNKKAKIGHRHPENFFKYLKTQFKHGYYRVKLYKDHPDMMKGDKYSGNAKWMVILSGLLLGSLIGVLVSPLLMLSIFFIVSFGLFYLQKDLFMFFLARMSIKESFGIVGIQIVRALAWGFGYLKGLLLVIF